MSKPSDDFIKSELAEYLDNSYQELSEQKKNQLFESYKKSRKTEVIYIYWFFNLHYGYIGKWWSLALFILTIGGFGVWWLIDLFRLTTILREYNKNKAFNLLKKL